MFERPMARRRTRLARVHACRHAAFVLALVFTAAARSFGQCKSFQIQVGYAPDCTFTNEGAVPFAINEVGQVLGMYGLCSGAGETFIWTGKTHFVAPYDFTPQGTNGTPRAINDLGSLVGYMEVPGGNGRSGFIYAGGRLIDLGSLPSPFHFTEALSLNNANEVVGYSATGVHGYLNAFIWRNGVISDLNLPVGPSSIANDINQSGQIVGWMGVDPVPLFVAQPFLWHNGNLTVLPLPRGAITGEAKAISDNGRICGTAGYPAPGRPGFVQRGFALINGVITDLGILPGFTNSRALGINDLGQVVGYCDGGSIGNPAFIWQNGVLTSLGDFLPPGTNLRINIAHSINNQGQIAAQGTDPTTFQQVVMLLTPIPSMVGDYNCDKRVNVDDLLGVINHWGMSNSLADFNHNGIVDLPDLMIVIEYWTM